MAFIIKIFIELNLQILHTWFARWNFKNNLMTTKVQILMEYRICDARIITYGNLKIYTFLLKFLIFKCSVLY